MPCQINFLGSEKFPLIKPGIYTEEELLNEIEKSMKYTKANNDLIQQRVDENKGWQRYEQLKKEYIQREYNNVVKEFGESNITLPVNTTPQNVINNKSHFIIKSHINKLLDGLKSKLKVKPINFKELFKNLITRKEKRQLERETGKKGIKLAKLLDKLISINFNFTFNNADKALLGDRVYNPTQSVVIPTEVALQENISNKPSFTLRNVIKRVRNYIASSIIAFNLNNREKVNWSALIEQVEPQIAPIDSVEQLESVELEVEQLEALAENNIETNELLPSYLDELASIEVVQEIIKPVVQNNTAEIEAKKADIEKRKQEELNGENYRIPISKEVRNWTDEDGTKFETTITTFKDGSKQATNKNLETKAKTPISKYSGELSNEKIYEVESPNAIERGEVQQQEVKVAKIVDIINAKYDAELAALEQEQQEQQEPNTESAETQAEQLAEQLQEVVESGIIEQVTSSTTEPINVVENENLTPEEQDQVLEDKLVETGDFTRPEIQRVRREVISKEKVKSLVEFVNKYLNKGVTNLKKYSPVVLNFLKKLIKKLIIGSLIYGYNYFAIVKTHDAIVNAFSIKNTDQNQIEIVTNNIIEISKFKKMINFTKDEIQKIQNHAIEKGISVDAAILDIYYQHYSNKTIEGLEELSKKLHTNLSDKVSFANFSPDYLKPFTLEEKNERLGVCEAGNECAEYVNNVFKATKSLLNILGNQGLFGNAWTETQFIVNRGGKFMYNIYDNPKYSKKNIKADVAKIRSAINSHTHEGIENYVAMEGDVVGLFYANSDNHLKAYGETNSMKIPAYHTHLGFIRYIGGEPYVEHNIHGTVHQERLDLVINNQSTTGIKIAQIARPKYLVERAIGIYTPATDYNSVTDLSINKLTPHNNMFAHWETGQAFGVNASLVVEEAKSSVTDSTNKNLTVATVYVLAGQESSWGLGIKGQTFKDEANESKLGNKLKDIAAKVTFSDKRPSIGMYQFQERLLKKMGIEYTIDDLYSLKKSTQIATQVVEKYIQQIQNSPVADQFNSLSFSEKVAVLSYVHNRGIESYTEPGGLNNIVQRMVKGELYKKAVMRTNYLNIPNVDRNYELATMQMNINAESLSIGIVPNINLSEFTPSEKGQSEIANRQEDDTIKPGVAELFESNPELANAVYEALGFKSNLSLKDRNQILEENAYRIPDKEEFFDTINDDNEKESFKLVTYKDGHKTLFAIDDNGKNLGRISDFNEGVSNNKIFEFTNDAKLISTNTSGVGRSMQEKILSKHIPQITPQQKQQAQQLYSQYLDTIFPDSKIKDVLKHTTSTDIDIFKKGTGRLGEGIYFAATDYIMYDKAGENTYKIIANVSGIKRYDNGEFNIKANQEFPTKDEYSKEPQKKLQKQDKTQGVNAYVSTAKTGTEYNIFEPEQIHILGSKQDIEGFREFINNREKGQSVESQKQIELLEKQSPEFLKYPQELIQQWLDEIQPFYKTFFSFKNWLDEKQKGIFWFKSMKQIVDDSGFLTQRMNEKLEEAKKLKKEGHDNAFIWRMTGWDMSRPDRPKSEIPDGKINNEEFESIVKEINTVFDKETIIRIKDIYENDLLYSIYPELQNIAVVFYYDDSTNSRGSVNSSEIKINLFYKDSIRETLIHEIQHSIQDMTYDEQGTNPRLFEKARNKEWEAEISIIEDRINKGLMSFEDFLKTHNMSIIYSKSSRKYYVKHSVKGLSFKPNGDLNNVLNQLKEYYNRYAGPNKVDDYQLYLSTIGETEARNVETRFKLTDEQKKALPIYETEDIEREYQISKLLFRSNDNLYSFVFDYVGDGMNFLKNPEILNDLLVVEKHPNGTIGLVGIQILSPEEYKQIEDTLDEDEKLSYVYNNGVYFNKTHYIADLPDTPQNRKRLEYEKQRTIKYFTIHSKSMLAEMNRPDPLEEPLEDPEDPTGGVDPIIENNNEIRTNNVVTVNTTNRPSVVNMTDPVEATRVTKTLDMLSKKFGLKWRFDSNMDERGEYRNGVIYVNPSKLRMDTLWHEFLHPWIRVIMKEKPALYNAIKNEVLNTEEGQRIFRELSGRLSLRGEDLIEEALVEFLGRKAAAKQGQSESSNSLFKQFKNTVVDIISSATKSIFLDDLSETTVDDLMDFLLDENTTIRFHEREQAAQVDRVINKIEERKANC